MNEQEGFNRSQRARDSEYVTSYDDMPLVAQFGTNSPMEMSMAAEKVASYAQAIDLNCGCPQKWATKDGIGAALSRKPDLVRQMVSDTRSRVGDMPCSIKIRVLPDLRQTVELVQRAEAVGVAWITVHGRTPEQRRQPADHDTIATVKAAARVPIIANGDIFTPTDVTNVLTRTKVDGYMSARGALANPALFGGYSTVPMRCVTDYLQLALEYGGNFTHHHHHILYMLFAHLSRADRREFTLLRSLAAVVDFFERRCWWPPIDDGIDRLPSLLSFPLSTPRRSKAVAAAAPSTSIDTSNGASKDNVHVPLFDAAASTATSINGAGSNDGSDDIDGHSLADPSRIYKGRIR
jgi:tRNA-dihydrouridine synthase 4